MISRFGKFFDLFAYFIREKFGHNSKYVDLLLDAQLSESQLQDFEVSEEFVLEFRFPIDFIKGHLSRETGVKQLTIHCTSPELLDFCKGYLV